MKQGIFTVTENVKLTPTTWRMRLAGDTSDITNPGQFINIRLEGHFLRRPISVNDVRHPQTYTGEGLMTESAEGEVTIIYKVLGHGTEEMTHMKPGRRLDILTGLGNGYDLTDAGDRPLLIGGGVGIPPLYLAAKELIKESKEKGLDRKVTVILGFNTSEEMYYIDEFEKLGCKVVTATADGSFGVPGFVTDAFRVLTTECSSQCTEDEGPDADKGSPEKCYSMFYTCGPEPMLKALYNEVYKEAGIPGQMSFEERMGCGFGACMGCSCKTVTGYKRICKDGPVLRTEEVLW